MNIGEFVRKHQLVANSTRIPDRPDEMGDWKGATHWVVTLSQTGRGNPRTFTTFYSMGSAHKGAPKIDSVLSSLMFDASGAENASSFEDWASEYGYDTDSRKAERMYNACREISAKLRVFLGRDAYNELLRDVEPD